MDLNSAIICPTPAVSLVRLFSLVWPFLVLGMLRSRVRSSAPVAATLAPLAFSTAAMWSVLELTGSGMAITPMPRAEAAGVAEALTMTAFGAFGAALVAVFALVRRHAAVIDGVSAAILGVTMLNAAGGIVTGENLRALLTLALCRTGMAAGVLAGACAIAWSAWHARGDRPLRPIAYGVPVAAVLIAIVAAIAWQRHEQHLAIAFGG